MNNCLFASQLYDEEYLFCISMPNKISVPSSLSHMMKVWKNLKLPIADPSTVFKCTAAGSILVLYQSSIVLYMLVWTSERVAPESIRVLDLLPACTVTVGQFDTSPMV